MDHLEKHTVPPLPTPQRLSDYCVGIFEAIPSRKGIKKAIQRGRISINGRLGYTGDWLRGGEVLVLRQAKINPNKKQIDFPLEVVYEDDYLAVVHKPGGILTSGNTFMTIANALPQNLAPSRQKEALLAPQPAHRLDYATSGLLLIGKTASSLTTLNKAFEKQIVEKSYHAVAAGEMQKQGIITSPIDGKPAQSHYQCLQRVPSERYGCLNLLQLRPKTGRRHQLRLHLVEIGHPILGDKDYASGQLKNFGKGLYLQASSLQFVHPIHRELMYFELELPKKFKKIFNLK